MSDDKPLHVRVAEALGYYSMRRIEGDLRGEWVGLRPSVIATGLGSDIFEHPPRYDTDWAVTGPLVEIHGILLWHCWPGDHGQDGFHWNAFRSGDVRSPDEKVQDIEGTGDTPLLAVCNLILALKEAGKL